MTAIYSTATTTTTGPMLFNSPTFLYSPSPRFPSSLLPSASSTIASLDLVVYLLATVNAYPKPDDKIRSTSLKVQGSGNAGNALTCAVRLGLNARVISKVANDAHGRVAVNFWRSEWKAEAGRKTWARRLGGCALFSTPQNRGGESDVGRG